MHRTILSAHFLAVITLRVQEINTSILKQESALLAAALSNKASIFVDKLQNLYNIYKSFVGPFIWRHSCTPSCWGRCLHSLHIWPWCYVLAFRCDCSPCCLLSCLVPISLPLIRLTQLVWSLVVCHVANLTAGEFRIQLFRAMGHLKVLSLLSSLQHQVQHQRWYVSFPT